MSVGEGRVLASTYEWKIVNYSSYVDLETGKYISSPTYNVDCNSWHLRLYPNGNKGGGKEMSIILYLNGDVRVNTEIQARLALSMINGKNAVIGSYDLNEIKSFTYRQGWGAFFVLAANSTVFAAMFEHKMRENEENKVTIEDVSYKVFNELLTFFYTGKCTMSKDLVSGLSEAADKYQVLELKDMCEEELCKKVSVENTIALLQLADMHNAEHLKKKAIDFITQHGKEMVDRPEFDSLKNLHPDLFRDVFRAIFARAN